MPLARPVVLVLDDDRATRDLVQEILEEQGYTVESAASGASGLARLESGGIDLVVLDRTLPDRDGLDVCRWVRAREDSDRAHLPIIMVSASVPAGEETMEPGPGADAYVAKPFDIDALVAQVRSSLGTPPPDQAPAPTAPR